jgi:hypothetical protein
MLRKEIIKRYIETDAIQHVIGHNGSILMREVLRTFLFLLISYVLYLWLKKYLPWEYWSWIFAGIGLYIFVKFIINFLNLYLDSLVLTERWVTLFMREWIWDHKTDVFEREKIETISFNQNSIWDKIFGKWDISIRLEHGVEFPFDNVSWPKKQVWRLIRMKDFFMAQKTERDLQTDTLEDNKFNILVEALWEVVKEYMEKKSPKSWYHDDI